MLNTLKRSAQKGFTLVELAIVIAILGILSAVALSNLGSTTAAAECSMIKDMKAKLNSGTAQYLAATATMPGNFSSFVTNASAFTAGALHNTSIYGFGPKVKGTTNLCTIGATLACPNAFQNYNPTFNLDTSSGVVTTATPIPKTTAGANAPDCN